MNNLYLGTANFGSKYGVANDVQMPIDEIKQILTWCKNRIHFLDYSPDYFGASETLNNYGTSFKITTKINLAYFETAEEISQHVQIELENLKVSKFHQLLVRFPEKTEKKIKHFWTILCNLKAEGLFSSLGFSIYTPKELVEAANEFQNIDVFQVPENLLNREFSQFLLKEDQFRDSFEFIVRSIFLQGAFFLDIESLPKQLQPLKESIFRIQTEAKLQDCTIVDLVVSYTQQLSWSSKTVIGVNSLNQLKQIYEAFAQPKQLSQRYILEMPEVSAEATDPRTWE